MRGVYEREKGSNTWWIHWHDQNGRRHREIAGTRSNAVMLYRKRKTEALQHKKLPELDRKFVTFAELTEDALEYSRAHKKSFQDDEERMRPLVDWFGTRPAESIRPAEITNRLNSLHRTEATRNRYRALMSLCYRLGIENEKVSVNPVRLTRRWPENNARTRFLSPQEETRLRQAICNLYPQRLPDFEIAVNTGMRQGEQYALTWSEVDLPRRMLTVRISKPGEGRHIPLNGSAIQALEVLYKCTVSQAEPERRVFDVHRPRHWFEPAMRMAKVEGLVWHDLRHTFASRLVMLGVPLRSVQELLGHKSIVTTMRYAHLAPDYQVGTVEKLMAYSQPPKQPSAIHGSYQVVVGP